MLSNFPLNRKFLSTKQTNTNLQLPWNFRLESNRGSGEKVNRPPVNMRKGTERHSRSLSQNFPPKPSIIFLVCHWDQAIYFRAPPYVYPSGRHPPYCLALATSKYVLKTTTIALRGERGRRVGQAMDIADLDLNLQRDI